MPSKRPIVAKIREATHCLATIKVGGIGEIILIPTFLLYTGNLHQCRYLPEEPQVTQPTPD